MLVPGRITIASLPRSIVVKLNSGLGGYLLKCHTIKLCSDCELKSKIKELNQTTGHKDVTEAKGSVKQQN